VRVVREPRLEAAAGEGPTEPDPSAGERLVVVTWRDAFFDFEREADEPTRGDYLVRTAGFVIADGPTFLSIAQEVLPAGEGFRAVTHVPLAIVENVVDLSPEARLGGAATAPTEA